MIITETIVSLAIVSLLFLSIQREMAGVWRDDTGFFSISKPYTHPFSTLLLLAGFIALGTCSLVAATPSAAGPDPQPAPPSGIQLATPATPTPPRLGPTLPEDIRLWDSDSSTLAWLDHRRLRIFGWLSGGYTWSDSGDGLLRVAPRVNRFGDEWLLNQAAVVFERGLDPKDWSWGFRTEFYCGADAALLRPLNGFGPDDNPRFGTDLRQLYLSLHLPWLSEGGIDWKVGRIYVPIGYESTMSPYRPMYSAAYVWQYSQTGAATGSTATWHVDPQLDLILGVNLGFNTFFELRGDGPSYITRAAYWLTPEKKTRLVGTVYTGPQPIATTRGHVADWQTVVEAQIVHHWSPRFTTAVELNLGWDIDNPATGGTSQWYGGYVIGITHLHPQWDLNLRAEGFNDSDGSRTGLAATYGEFTLGLNYMPRPWLNFRPEVRLDVADPEAFGPVSNSEREHRQVTAAIDCVVKF